MHYHFYATLKKEENSTYYNVKIPNIIGAVTCGDSYENAMIMAYDLLKYVLEENISNAQYVTSSSYEEILKYYPEADEIIELCYDLPDDKKKPREQNNY